MRIKDEFSLIRILPCVLKYEIIMAGCQIFYAVKCEEKPNTGRVMEWHSSDDGKVVENERPTKIYIAE